VSITIYGASDDLIEIEGDIRAEFSATGDGDYVALSNGCIFRIAYDGVWRITHAVLRKGVEWRKVEATHEDDDNYSDRVTVEDGVTWVTVAPGENGYAVTLS
jgi:hypothetical protein